MLQIFFNLFYSENLIIFMNIILLAFIILPALSIYLFVLFFINPIDGELNNMCPFFVDTVYRMAKVNELWEFTLFKRSEIIIWVLGLVIMFKDLYFEKE